MKHKMEGSLLPNQKQSALYTSQLGDKFVISQLERSCQEGLTAFKLHRLFLPVYEPHGDLLKLGNWEERLGNSSSIKIYFQQ